MTTDTKRDALLREAITAVGAARATILKLCAHVEQAAAGSGLMPRVVPLFELLGQMENSMARAQAELDGHVYDPPAAPPRAGYVRVRLLQKFYDRNGGVTGAIGYLMPGDVADVSNAFAPDMLAKGIAAAVAA
jgi:hypothetical protein